MVAPELKERYVNVYLPSKADKEMWGQAAKDRGVPLSKFIYEAVESFLSNDNEAPRLDLIKELSETKEECQKLRSELRIKSILLEKLEGEVYKARYTSFTDLEMDEGTRKHDEALIRILKRGKTLDGYQILSELGINPKEVGAVKLVNNQLESLQRFGLVTETANGWRWVT